jgi:hypothetical protein
MQWGPCWDIVLGEEAREGQGIQRVREARNTYIFKETTSLLAMTRFAHTWLTTGKRESVDVC